MAEPDDNNLNNNGVESSYLTKPISIVGWLVLCVIAALFEKTPIALFLGFIFILTLASYLWARHALKNVDYIWRSDRIGVFPGQTFIVKRTIVNRKALPLIWVEIRESCEADDPAAPPSEFIVMNEEYAENKDTRIRTYERLYTLSLVHWYGQVTFPDEWTAHRRGIMEVGEAIVRSGDGFGLCAVGRPFELPGGNRIIVFPNLVDVSVSSIINDMWETRSRTTGYLEDRTAIKSIRDYRTGDPVRNINMRLLARGQSIKTNVYEIVTPDAVLFILDPGSFRDTTSHVFEEALSVTTSLIDALSRRGIAVSLFVPTSKWYKETCTNPSCAESYRFEMFSLLAAASNMDEPINGLPPDWVEEVGKIYYIAASSSKLTSPNLIGLLPEHKTRIMTPDELDKYRIIGKTG